MKKRLFAVSALLLGFVLLFSGVVFAWSTTAGDGTRYSMVRETGVFFNNSGGDITCGNIVIVDTLSTETGSGATLQQAVVAGTTMGSYITTTATPDSSRIVGVMLHGTAGSRTCGNQEACVVVTKGPAQVLVLDATDAVATGERISTSTTAGRGGLYNSSGTVAHNIFQGYGVVGIALQDGTGADDAAIWTWVNPS